MDAWQKAVDFYREGLTEKEKKLFAESKPEDVLQDVVQQEAAQREASRTRAFAQKLQPLLASIEQMLFLTPVLRSCLRCGAH
jgi:hypothetical protein